MKAEGSTDWVVVLREYEQERWRLEAEFHRRRDELNLIITDVQRKIDEAQSSSGAAVLSPVSEYAGMKILPAAMTYLAMIRRPSKAAEVAQTLLRGGMTTRGAPANFSTSVYNTLYRESKREHGAIAQTEDKGFVLRKIDETLD